MGFAPHKESQKAFLKYDTVPAQILELPQPDYFMQLVIILLVVSVSVGVSTIDPWARTEYTYQSTSYYAVMVAYAFTAAICCGIILVCANILIFSKDPAAPDMPDDYNNEDVPEGNGYEDGQ